MLGEDDGRSHTLNCVKSTDWLSDRSDVSRSEGEGEVEGRQVQTRSYGQRRIPVSLSMRCVHELTMRRQALVAGMIEPEE
jgi:hypothetical protein